ncbi:MAG: hypothetical protein WCV56_07455 [Candidatus Omnitrophota bacterium]
MRNIFAKSLVTAVFIAVSQMCCPVFVSGLTLEETLEFFSNTEPMYNEITGEDHPGVDICIFWKKAGIKPTPAYPGVAEYLFRYDLAEDKEKILFHPEIVIEDEGEIRILRVGALLQSDYQFLLFKREGDDWFLFDHIDLYSQKYKEPEIRFLDDGLFYIDQLEMSGTGVSLTLRVFYVIDGGKARICLKVPLEGWVDGWGMMFSRNFEADIQFYENKLFFDYVMEISGNTYFYAPAHGDTPEQFPLFSFKRRAIFDWDGSAFQIAETDPVFKWDEIDRLFYWDEKPFYEEFKDGFDSLQNGDASQKEWYEIFMEKLGLSD